MFRHHQMVSTVLWKRRQQITSDMNGHNFPPFLQECSPGEVQKQWEGIWGSLSVGLCPTGLVENAMIQ